MPSHRAWWFALLVVQIVIALAGLAIGLGILLGTGFAVPSPDFFADRDVRGVAIMIFGASSAATAFSLMRGHRLALAGSALGSVLLMAWTHRVTVAVGQHSPVGVFFMVLAVLQLLFVLLVLGIDRGVPAPARSAPAPEPAPEPDHLDR
ncbi:hypothetical protein [Arenivirga flava]|uniref:DUF4345 domain-containing protein n=1 Tax=Arenivirga flava TaxID=1930060 RepID=A0AA37XB67_9MICO|nr:hypothetical protein [Arenivirga flava]GMA28423.1 hypothetical protein GCM10025874_16760 [Arenivirga flava]